MNSEELFGKTFQDVKSIGSSLYIRLPKTDCDVMNIKKGDTVVVWFRKKEESDQS